MKKLCFALCICAATFALAACSNSGKSNKSDDSAGSGAVITFSAGEGVFDDGGASKSVRAASNGKVNFAFVPHRDGYAFEGWYSGATEFDPNVAYEAEREFTARYVSGADNVVYEALFDEDSTVAIDINMKDEQWKKLDADSDEYSKSPIYRYADSVTISIKSGGQKLDYYYEGVGVRMKGNTSRHNFYDDRGFYESIHMKLAFQELFDDTADGYKAAELMDWSNNPTGKTFRKLRVFGGMSKIDIKYNSTLDESYIKELYAMKIFRDNDIYAPNITLASVRALNKNTEMKNLGVYRVQEVVDEAFVTRYIEQNQTSVGDLWKCGWGNQGGGGSDLTPVDLDNRVGVNDELKDLMFAYEKKTNKKKDKTTGLRDFSSVKNFINNLDNVVRSAGENLASIDFSQYVDTDYFARFEAVNWLMGNPDCIRTHANNYYLYFRKSDNKAIFIPYDYDRCLGSRQWDPNGDGMVAFAPLTNRTTMNHEQLNPLYKYLLADGAPSGQGTVQAKYLENLAALAQSNIIMTQSFNAVKNKYKVRYSQYTSTAVKGNTLAFDELCFVDDNKSIKNKTYDVYIAEKLAFLDSSISA